MAIQSKPSGARPSGKPSRPQLGARWIRHEPCATSIHGEHRALGTLSRGQDYRGVRLAIMASNSARAAKTLLAGPVSLKKCAIPGVATIAPRSAQPDPEEGSFPMPPEKVPRTSTIVI